MTLHNEYLTDEELEQLISEVEDCDLVTAPPDFAKHVMSRIGEKRKTKSRDFAGYCFRVGLSVAAAVAFIFIMPYQSEATEWKEQWNVEAEIPEPDYPTREEVLNDTGILHRVLNGDNIITETEFLNDLTGKDGGQ